VRTRLKLLHCLLLSWLAISVGNAALADSISIRLTPFTGDEIGVELTLSDDEDGSILGRLEVLEGVGDLRGVFLDITDTSLLSGLRVTGADVTGFETGSVINLGHGSNLNGGGSPCPCDIGIEFGSSGVGRDDIAVTEFVLVHASLELDLSLFRDQLAGARVTSVGDGYDSDREGSSKLAGVVPEPSTGVILGLGLAGLGWRRRRA